MVGNGWSPTGGQRSFVAQTNVDSDLTVVLERLLTDGKESIYALAVVLKRLLTDGKESIYALAVVLERLLTDGK